MLKFLFKGEKISVTSPSYSNTYRVAGLFHSSSIVRGKTLLIVSSFKVDVASYKIIIMIEVANHFLWPWDITF